MSWIKKVVFLLLLAQFSACLSGTKEVQQSEEASALQSLIIPIKTIEDSPKDNLKDLTPLKEVIGDSRVVMLGGTGGGDGSSLKAKTRLVKYLHEKLDFDVILFESGYYDTYKVAVELEEMVDPVLSAKEGIPVKWSASKQAAPLFKLIGDEKIQVAGFDCRFSSNNAKTYLAIDLESYLLRSPIRKLKGWRTYKSVLTKMTKQPEYIPSEKNQKIFWEMMDTVRYAVKKSQKGEERTRWQRILNNIEQHHKSVWNEEPAIRREQIAKNILWLLDEKYKEEKVIVWGSALNTVYQADELQKMIEETILVENEIKESVDQIDDEALEETEKEIVKRKWVPFEDAKPDNLGALLKKELGEEVYNIGFTGYSGKNRVADEIQIIPNAPANSMESLLKKTGYPYSFLNFKSDFPDDHLLRQSRICRAIEHENLSCDWTTQFDGLFYIELLEENVMVVND